MKKYIRFTKLLCAFLLVGPSIAHADLLKKAEAAEASHHFKQAVGIYQRLVVREPEELGLKIAYARNLMLLQRYSEAENQLYDVLQHGQSSEALLLLSDIQIAQSRWQGARVILESVLPGDRNATYYFNLAQVAEKLGDQAAADAAFAHYQAFTQSP